MKMNGMLMCASDQYLGYTAYIKRHRAKETYQGDIINRHRITSRVFLSAATNAKALYEKSASTDQLGTTLWPAAKL